MVRHLAGIAEVVEDVGAAVAYYRDVLGLSVEHDEGSTYAVVQVAGVLHFGVWARRAAAEATFGDGDAADRIPLGFTIGFEVDSVEDASRSTGARGWPMAQVPHVEPWGQKTSRLFSPSGALCEFSEMPGARRIARDLEPAD